MFEARAHYKGMHFQLNKLHVDVFISIAVGDVFVRNQYVVKQYR